MKQLSRATVLIVLSFVGSLGCAESDDSTVTGGSAITGEDGGLPTTRPADAGLSAGDATMEPPVTGKPDAGTSADAGTTMTPSGDACMDAASRIAGCFLSRQNAGTPACKAGAIDATPTVARFLIAGGSCPTLIKQGITLSTPCDQAPLPMHVTQLVNYPNAAKLCSDGPVNTADTCTTACKNAAPCVDSKMLDEKLKDAVRCFDGCIRNAEDAMAFSCSAKTVNDCNALAEKCWTAP